MKHLTTPAEVLAALAALPPVTNRAAIADRFGLTPGQLAPLLKWLEKRDMVERYDDAALLAADPRVMLTARAADLLRLTLSPRGDRWRPSDRPAVSA